MFSFQKSVSKVSVTRMCSDDFTCTDDIDLEWGLELVSHKDSVSMSISIFQEYLNIEFENEETEEFKNIAYALEDFEVKIVERKRKYVNNYEIKPDEIIIYENDKTMEVYF